MKVIKLFITSILLLSSFQTFAAFSITTAANVSTPENTDKVIKLTVNKNGFNEVTFGKRKFTMSGKDVNKFTISGEDLKSKLTFKATAFEAGSDNTYSVNIKAEFRFMTETSSIAYTQTTEKTITVTVTKNPDNGEHVPTFRITTANVSTPENTDKVIKLTVNKNGFNELIFGRRKFTMSGKDVNKFTISDEDLKSKLTFKATAFEAGSDNTYSVNIKAEFRFMTGPSSVAYTQTTEKTITVTVTKDPDNGEHVPTFHITTVDVSTPENTDKVIMLATNIDDLKYKTTFTITGGADVKKFTLAGNKLTFKATAFEARKDATYRVKIKATPNIFLPLPGTGLEDEKTLTVTVTKANTGGNPDDNGALRITTADVSTPENTDKVITLITNKSDTNVFKNMLTIFTIVDGADAKRFTLAGNKLTFKATAFKAQSNTYRVKIKVFQERFDRGFSPWAFPPSETAYKTLTVTVTKNPDDNGKYVPTFRITTDNVSTPENTDKVIMLATNIDDLKYKTTFTITGGADVKKFTLAGNKLTFKATAFEARKDATYRVKIKATPDIFLWILLFSQTTEKTIVDWIPQTTEKTITVTVTKNPDNGKYVPTFRITTDNVSTPENTDKVIMLATNIDDLKYETNFTITGGADVKKFTLAGNKLTFKATAFEARKDATYRVKIKAALGTGISFFDWILLFPQTTEKTIVDWIPQTTEKTITVTVTKANTGGNPDDNGALRITTADAFSTPENNPNMVISLTTNKDANKDVDVNFSITGGADQDKFTLSGNTLTFAATDFEARSDHAYSVIITASEADKSSVSKTITVTVTDLNDVAPTNIQISNTNLLKGQPAGTVVGTLSATDTDTAADALTFTTTSADFNIVNGNELRTKRSITAIGDIAITVTVSDGIQSTDKNFTIKVVEKIGALIITTKDNFSAPKNADKVIVLAANKSGVRFFIADKNAKFSLSDNILTFKATNFKDGGDNIYRVNIKATKGDEVAKKTLVVTVTDDTPYIAIKLRITTANVSTLEKTDKVIDLTANKSGVSFSITGNDTDGNKFSLSGATLTFKATDFKDQGDNNTYYVNIKATKDGETTEKILAVTVIDDNVGVIREITRKESTAAGQFLAFKVGRTLMGRLSHIRLSHIRHKKNKKKDKEESSFSANGFVNGIQVSFADSQTNSFINRVLSANGLSNVIPISSRKVERWDTWTNAKVVIGKSNGAGANKTEFNLKSLNIGMDRRIAQDKIIGFALGLGKQDRTATGSDFSGEVDTTQYTLSSYGALELSDKGSIEAVLGVAKATHDISNSADQDNSNGFFASIAYRADLQAQSVDLSPFIRYDISRIKMKANDILTSSETTTDEAIALGIDISKTGNYEEGQLTRFVSLEYKSDLRRDGNDYLSKNAEQEVIMKLGLDYQKDDTTTSVSYERIQSTNNKAHSYGIEGTVRWKF